MTDYMRNAEVGVPYGESKRRKTAQRSIRESTLRQGAELKQNPNNFVGKMKLFHNEI